MQWDREPEGYFLVIPSDLLQWAAVFWKKKKGQFESMQFQADDEIGGGRWDFVVGQRRAGQYMRCRSCCPHRLLTRLDLLVCESRFDSGRAGSTEQMNNGLDAIHSDCFCLLDIIRRESSRVVCRPTYMQVFGSRVARSSCVWRPHGWAA